MVHVHNNIALKALEYNVMFSNYIQWQAIYSNRHIRSTFSSAMAQASPPYVCQ